MTSTYRASLLSSRKLVPAFLKYRLAGSKPLKMIIKWLVYVSVIGSLVSAPRGFQVPRVGFSGLPLPSKTNIFLLQLDQEWFRRRTTTWMCYLYIAFFFPDLFILTQVWLFTCYPAQTHSASPQIAPGISCCVTSKAVPHDVESMSKAGRALRTGDQEPYEFSYLSPNKSSIPWSLPIWEASTFWPVY